MIHQSLTPKILTLAMVVLMTGLSGPLQAVEKFTIDASHSQVGFKIRHFFSKTPGRFTKYSGTIHFDSAKPEASSVEVEIDAASINTDDKKRDDHLRNEDFFDVKKHPKITFKSKAVKKTGDATADIVGDLTMKGVTKEVTLKAKFMGKGKDAWGGIRGGWEAHTSVNRNDFGITYNKVVEGANILGDEVEIELHVEAVVPSETPKK